MSLALAEAKYVRRDLIEHIVTEDDEPVDNLYSEKLQRMLTHSLYSSWTPPPDEDHPKKARKFLAAANVGIFFAVAEKPLVPDVFLSLDVAPHKDWYEKQHCTYFVWEFGKVPEVALEIVSNRKGKELTDKLKTYARWGIDYYVVYDPQKRLSKDVLCVYELGFGKRYRPRKDFMLPTLGLGLTLWQGVFEDHEDEWLRWLDAEGRLIQTGEERAAQAERRAAQAEQRAAHAETQASQETQRASNAEAELEKLRAELAQLKRSGAKKKNKT
ncbi:MAG: Uma2 family endonuclease [Acidobacteria bacterium]|nr:Uma2 family endonuclease [Acidobacteriota bacterium]